MTRYYFDIRDDLDLITDDEVVDLRDFQAAVEEAARTLADIGRDSVRKRTDVSTHGYSIAIDVRDRDGLILQVKFTLEIVKTREVH